MIITIACIVMSYNSGSFLVETLDSILNQTRLPDQLIITDDFSDDNSRSLIRSWFLLNSTRFNFAYLHFPDFRQGTNLILADALKIVSADYTKPMAADDLLSSKYLESLEDFISIYNPDAVFTKSRIINEKSAVLNYSEYPNRWLYEYILPAGPIFARYCILKLMYIPSYSAIFSTLTLVNIRDPNIFLLEDWPMWLALLYNNYSVFFLNQSLCSYRIHPTQITSSTKLDSLTAKWLSRDKDMIKSIVNFYERKLPPVVSVLFYVDSFFTKAYNLLSPSSSRELTSLIVVIFLRISSKFSKPNLPAFVQLSDSL